MGGMGGMGGMVTAEMAAVLPVLALLLSFALWAVSVAAAQVRCSDAAREAARAAARGEPESRVRLLATRIGPARSSVTVQRNTGDVEIRVSSTVHWLGHGPVAVSVAAIAVAALEPGTVTAAADPRVSG